MKRFAIFQIHLYASGPCFIACQYHKTAVLMCKMVWQPAPYRDAVEREVFIRAASLIKASLRPANSTSLELSG